MVEEVIISYLTGKLTVPVSGEVPTPRPTTFVTVERTGGSCTNKIRTDRLAIQSWAASEAEAAALNELVIGAMEESVSCNEISKSKLNSNYNFTDTTTKHHRYQAVFDVVHF